MPKSVRGVMREFKTGALHSGAGGPVVTNPKQAVAIALSEQRQLHPKMAAHGRKVAAAHKALAKTPAFKAAHPLQRFAMVQAHVRRGGK